LAQHFTSLELRREPSEDVKLVKTFFESEFGTDFPLTRLLDYGVGIHNAGMSGEARALTEWLMERGELDLLVATTTIAQGINFPITGVVLAAHQYAYGEEMSPSDFWNLAGRAGRTDQNDIGIVAIAMLTKGNTRADNKYRTALERFIGKQVGALNSALLKMVQDAAKTADIENLPSLAYKPEWSSFLQYLSHTYRMIGDHDSFVQKVELVLRGTLGFRSLRQTHPKLATQLLTGVRNYSEKMRRSGAGQLALVDLTGFSLESISGALGRLQDTNVNAESWSSDLFSEPRPHLHEMMGVLLGVPELRASLNDVIGSKFLNGDSLARAICDWVQGDSVAALAKSYFDGDVAKCCQVLFQKVSQTTAWGLSALQTLTLGPRREELSEDERRTIMNLPARVFYGVNSDRALALRLAGVPRTAAEPLAKALKITPDMPTTQIRSLLKSSGDTDWRNALGERGKVYRTAWQVMEGME